MRSFPNVAPTTNSGKPSRDNQSHISGGYAEKSPDWPIGAQTERPAKANPANRIAPGYGGSVFHDAGNSGRVATDQAARKADAPNRRDEEYQARQAARKATGAGFPLSGGYDSKSRSIQARGGATLKTERAAVGKTAAPRHR